MSPAVRLRRATAAKSDTRATVAPEVLRSVRAGHAAVQQAVNESHDPETPWESEYDPHIDDGWADAHLPDLVGSDDLDPDDPAREVPRRPARARPKIRWWVVDPGNPDPTTWAPIQWAVRGPGLGSAMPAITLALHEERLAALAEVVARDHADAVRAATLWDALLHFRTTTADHLYKRMDQRLSSVADNLSRLGGTVVRFPWGTTTLSTLTKLSQKGPTAPLVEPLVELAAELGHPNHPERRASPRRRHVDIELKALRAGIAARYGCEENTLLKQQPGLLEVLDHPERVFAARARQPLAAWERVAAELGPAVSERIAVMAVAGAFDAQLVPLFRARVPLEER